MAEIINATWYTPWTTNLDIIGIVKVKDHEEVKFYIGTGKGKDAHEDIRNILERGARFYPEIFEEEL